MKNIISYVHRDELTGLPICQDRYGYFHVLDRWETVLPPSIKNRIYITTLSYGLFPDVNNFYSIPNELTGEPNTKYKTPVGKALNIFFVMISQDRLKSRKKDKEGPEMSLLGVFVDSRSIMGIPFRYDVHYVLAESLRFPTSAGIELKLRPCSRRTRVGILVGGFLTEET